MSLALPLSSLARTLVLLALFSFAYPLTATAQVAGLEGDCVLSDGSPAASVLEVFFDLGGASPEKGVASERATLAADGSYHVPVPALATMASLRVRVDGALHYGGRIYLRHRQHVDALQVARVVCGELVAVGVSVSYPD